MHLTNTNLLGLTANTSGVGNSFPKQNIYFLQLIFGFISEPSSELVCYIGQKFAINAKTGWESTLTCKAAIISSTLLYLISLFLSF